MKDLDHLEIKLSKALLKKGVIYDHLSDLSFDEVIEKYKIIAQSYVTIENNIAVLSDFKNDRSYSYIGEFGSKFGLSYGETVLSSAFEKFLFEKVHSDDLLERHALELNYLQLQNGLSADDRIFFSAHCRIRIKDVTDSYSIVNHRTQYLKSSADGGTLLSLCLYSPIITSNVWNGIEGRILNSKNGSVQVFSDFLDTGKMILSKREVEIIKLLSKGCSSKQISSDLNIAINTTYRHRQNILKKLNVYNTSQAVQVAMVLGIL